MRYLYLFFVLICLVSCKSKKVIGSAKTDSQTNSLCPQDGGCKLEVFKDKTLQIKTDDFGDMYTEMVQGKGIVLKFEYKKNETLNTEDGGYREEVFVELDPKNIEIETSDFQNTKLLFAKWCFCKGEAGYYRVEHGNLSVKKIDDKNYQFKLSFHVGKLQQIIQTIDQTFSIQ